MPGGAPADDDGGECAAPPIAIPPSRIGQETHGFCSPPTPSLGAGAGPFGGPPVPATSYRAGLMRRSASEPHIDDAGAGGRGKPIVVGVCAMDKKVQDGVRGELLGAGPPV